MSTEAFEDLYFDVCTMDYRKMARAMAPLEKRMRRADKVHLKSPGTDLRFSIKGIGAVVIDGTFDDFPYLSWTLNATTAGLFDLCNQADEFDLALGTPNLHRVRRKVEWIDRATVLPPELFDRFANDAFWAVPELNIHKVPVILYWE